MESAKADWHSLKLWLDHNEQLASQIKRVGQPRSFTSTEVLIDEGAERSEVYFILSGSVAISLYSSNGHEVRLSILGGGEWLGETAALLDNFRTATAVAIEDGWLIAISKQSFLDLMRTSGEFATLIAMQLADRISSTSRRVFEFAVFSASGRIYSELMRLSQIGADSVERLISPPPTVSELATNLSLTRETTSRAINKMERMRMLQRDNSQWRILAPDRLSELIS